MSRRPLWEWPAAIAFALFDVFGVLIVFVAICMVVVLLGTYILSCGGA